MPANEILHARHAPLRRNGRNYNPRNAHSRGQDAFQSSHHRMGSLADRHHIHFCSLGEVNGSVWQDQPRSLARQFSFHHSRDIDGLQCLPKYPARDYFPRCHHCAARRLNDSSAPRDSPCSAASVPGRARPRCSPPLPPFSSASPATPKPGAAPAPHLAVSTRDG